MPDAKYGEELCACVILREEADLPQLGRMFTLCLKKFAGSYFALIALRRVSYAPDGRRRSRGRSARSKLARERSDECDGFTNR